MEVVEIPIDSVVKTQNPRTVVDKEPLDDLANSIKEKGILQPLLVRKLEKDKYELISGSRRLEAAKRIGLKTVPARILEKADNNQIAEIRLEENIHRADLTPVEEGIAFKEYMAKTKVSSDTLAKKISKPKLYIERRLKIAELDPEIRNAVNDKKITIGHALAIARLSEKKEQISLLKEVIRDNLSVNSTIGQIGYRSGSKRLSDARFDKSGCKGCQHNGGEQTLLYDMGAELKGICLNPNCFAKKTQEWFQAEKTRLKDMGIQVLTDKEIESKKNLQEIHSWEEDINKVRSDMKKHPENYAVAYTNDYGDSYKEHIYRLKGAGKSGKKQQENEIRERQKKAKEKLKNKAELFKREFLIQNSRKLMKPNSKQSKALCLLSLIKDRFTGDEVQEMLKLVQIRMPSYTYYGSGHDLKHIYQKLFSLDEKVIDDMICQASCWRLSELIQEDLIDIALALETDMSKDFVIDKGFLELHTKDQLLELAKEIGLDKHLEKKGEKSGQGKRTDLIGSFLKSGFSLKGVVPKSMELPKEKKTIKG